MRKEERSRVDFGLPAWKGLKNLPRGVCGSIRGSIMSRQSFLRGKLLFFDEKQGVLIGAKKGDAKYKDRFEPLFKCIFPLGRARFSCIFAPFLGGVFM